MPIENKPKYRILKGLEKYSAFTYMLARDRHMNTLETIVYANPERILGQLDFERNMMHFFNAPNHKPKCQ